MNAARSDILKKLDAMTVRERLLVFTAVVVALGALADYFYVTPLMTQQKQLARMIDKQSNQMDAQRVRMQIDLMKSARSRADGLNAAIRAVEAEIALVDAEIAAIGKSEGEAATAVLARLLKKSDRIGLLRVSPLESDRTGNALRSGLEVTLSGTYGDLTKHLANLEQAVPNARWGAMTVNGSTQPSTLTLRVLIPAEVK